MDCDFLIVGAGFSGAVLARQLAELNNQKVLIIDRRKHIGGNCFDYTDEHGLMVHKYGPHYFRTNSDEIFKYLSRFTQWHHTEYKVLSHTHGKYWSFPINLKTFEQYLGRTSTTQEMVDTLNQWKSKIAYPKNSEELILSQVGPIFYEMFFKGYTQKQWKCSPKDLDVSVCGRIPIRTNYDDRYFSDKYQALPTLGYTQLFQKLITHPNITLKLDTDYASIKSSVTRKHLVYTGMIDQFYNYRYGVLPYRSVRFEVENIKTQFYQPALQVNYPNDHDYTRIVEVKHATGQIAPSTTIVREYPQDFVKGKDAFYPIPSPKCTYLYQKYKALADAETNVSFIGRLATYGYYNMDQVVAFALKHHQALEQKYSLTNIATWL